MSDTGFDGQRITAGTELILSLPAPLPPASLFTPTPKAARRVLEFFTAQINNPHTRRAYLNAARRFDAWCVAQLTDVQAFHVAAFIKDLQGEFSPPTVKQHLAALRMLFDWLVTGHVLDESHFRTALATNSGPLSDLICFGMPCLNISLANARRTSREDCLRATSIVKHSRVNSSTTFRSFSGRPSCVRSNTKS